MNVVNVVEYERVHVFVVECIHKLAGNRSRKNWVEIHVSCFHYNQCPGEKSMKTLGEGLQKRMPLTIVLLRNCFTVKLASSTPRKR